MSVAIRYFSLLSRLLVITNAPGIIQSGYLYPLIFEPGQGWAYGSGMDWAGRTARA